MNWSSGWNWFGLLVLLTMPFWLYFALPENTRSLAKWVTGVDPPGFFVGSACSMGDNTPATEVCRVAELKETMKTEHEITEAYVGFWMFVGRTARDIFFFWLPYLPIGAVVYGAVLLANKSSRRRD